MSCLVQSLPTLDLQSSLFNPLSFPTLPDKFLSFFPFFFFFDLELPCLGIKPMPPALEAWSLNHWTTREIPINFFLA